MASNKLTDKQILFCKEYLVDLNATQSAIRAGYSETTAYSIGSENLSKPEIQDYIQHLMDKRWVEVNISSEKILKAIAEIALDPATSTKDKLRALELLGKHKVLFTDKIDHTGEIKYVKVPDVVLDGNKLEYNIGNRITRHTEETTAISN